MKLFSLENITHCIQINFIEGRNRNLDRGWMLKNNMIHMIGSDIHRMEHAVAINRFKSSLTFEKIMGLGLMNNTL